MNDEWGVGSGVCDGCARDGRKRKRVALDATRLRVARSKIARFNS
jgi:hypothetical protein